MARPGQGPFLESPGSFSGPKPKFELKMWRVVAQVLAHISVHFVSLTDSFIVLNKPPILNANWANIKQLYGRPEK